MYSVASLSFIGHIFFFKKDFIYLFLERGQGRGKKGKQRCARETAICCLLHTGTWGAACDPGMCPGPEPNHFSVRNTQLNHTSRHIFKFFFSLKRIIYISCISPYLILYVSWSPSTYTFAPRDIISLFFHSSTLCNLVYTYNSTIKTAPRSL